MKRSHAMPFGARFGVGATEFRLWAPAAKAVELELSRGDAKTDAARQALRPRGDGWFELALADAKPGTRYAFRIDGDLSVPDPASRANPEGAHAPSMVIDPRAYDWRDAEWRGRPWEEAVIYELHIGTLTDEGTFTAAIDRLDDLVELGVTALEIMPVAAFPGTRNWGYDGVLPFAPAAAYGTPDDLKRLVDAAHGRGLMVLMDVVYNHFGPEGNYLHAYAPQFFNPQHQTPWGAAINFDADGSRTVRDFFIHNALYWIEEFHCDGLRMDAVHAMIDDSRPDFVSELTATVRRELGGERHVHIVLENDRNEARYLERNALGRPVYATAQWNDDVHHALHVIATGESDGYYEDYVEPPGPVGLLGRALAEGFAFHGEYSRHRDAVRGEPSGGLPPPAFISFTQTHDQVGNRALGERIAAIADPSALRALVACVLLAPSTPLLFMGEEFAASAPFLFFCDFGPELAQAVTRGRRSEFKKFARFRDPSGQAAIPDPNLESTFVASRLDWSERTRSPHSEWLQLYRDCLRVRREHVVPRLAGASHGGSFSVEQGTLLAVRWTLGDNSILHLLANLQTEPRPEVARPPGELIYSSEAAASHADGLGGFGVIFTLEHPT